MAENVGTQKLSFVQYLEIKLVSTRKSSFYIFSTLLLLPPYGKVLFSAPSSQTRLCFVPSLGKQPAFHTRAKKNRQNFSLIRTLLYNKPEDHKI
jgi:hypothetical protein